MERVIELIGSVASISGLALGVYVLIRERQLERRETVLEGREDALEARETILEEK